MATSDLLPPCAETVVALAEDLGAGRAAFPLRAMLRRDPGALAAYLSYISCSPFSTAFSRSSDIAPKCVSAGQFSLPERCDPQLGKCLLSALEQGSAGGFADWSQPQAAAVYNFSQRIGAVARRLAALCLAPADAAEVAGLLAPLGLLVQQCGNGAGRSPADLAALTRRLARAWPLPAWLTHTLLSLDLATPLLACEGADQTELAKLAWIVQAAVGLVQEETNGEFMPQPGNSPTEALVRLGLSPEARPILIAELGRESPALAAPAMPSLVWRLVHSLANQEPKLAMVGVHSSFEAEQLRHQLVGLRDSEHQRLREMKMRALAEFAAGAGHEINNPLAVISGQAQHLLKTEENLDRARGLERIMSQCRRIHTLLRDVMLYARPPQIKPRRFSLSRILHSVLAELKDYALERRVKLSGDGLAPRNPVSGKNRLASKAPRLRGDPELLRTALVCLVRNAVEAAPADGWACARLEQDDNVVTVIVEDSGPGLAQVQREHLFDPFFSQRTAGRGSGLGLCKAWRIAQLHGGSLELHSEPLEPTRFVLTLPTPDDASPLLRQKAAARRVPRRRRRS